MFESERTKIFADHKAEIEKQTLSNNKAMEALKKEHYIDGTEVLENGDVRTVERHRHRYEVNQKFLPEIEKGDLLVIHDTGAHGFAMGYNYNGRLRSAEVLLKEDG